MGRNGETLKNRQRQNQPGSVRRRKTSVHGFTLIEMVFVIVIVLIMTAMTVPLVNSSMTTYRIHGAASAVSGSIQATRYQAIFNGYPFKIVFNSATLNYQVQSDPNRSGVFANFCVSGAAACPVPLTGTGLPITLDADTTFTFSPGGTVLSTTAVGGVTTMVLTYNGKTENITVSSYGNVKVTP